MKWETIWRSDSDDSNTERAMVIGGWVVKHETWTVDWHDGDRYEQFGGVAMTFVPDPDMTWIINKEE